MGGDFAPQVVLEGGLLAAREYDIPLILVGPRHVIEPFIAASGARHGSLEVCHAPEVVTMDEHPAGAIRQKPLSSIAVGLDLVKNGQADAFVSAGNTGAVMATALLRLGRLPGIERPALGAMLPTTSGRCLLLDVGANADCKPGYLLQFAHMGVAYMQAMGMSDVRVGLLNIGEEETKGNQLSLEAHQLLAKSGLHFLGNVEGKDLTRGAADVVVTDGFTGNVIIKTAEGLGEMVVQQIREVLTSKLQYKLAAALLLPAIKELARRFDYSESGGVPLLGVNGVVVIGHGRSNARAIQQAVLVASRAVEGNVVQAISGMAQ